MPPLTGTACVRSISDLTQGAQAASGRRQAGAAGRRRARAAGRRWLKAQTGAGRLRGRRAAPADAHRDRPAAGVAADPLRDRQGASTRAHRVLRAAAAAEARVDLRGPPRRDAAPGHAARRADRRDRDDDGAGAARARRWAEAAARRRAAVAGPEQPGPGQRTLRPGPKRPRRQPAACGSRDGKNAWISILRLTTPRRRRPSARRLFSACPKALLRPRRIGVYPDRPELCRHVSVPWAT